jgi:hypothetical protein
MIVGFWATQGICTIVFGQHIRQVECRNTSVWPSGLRRWLQVPFYFGRRGFEPLSGHYERSFCNSHFLLASCLPPAAFFNSVYIDPRLSCTQCSAHFDFLSVLHFDSLGRDHVAPSPTVGVGLESRPTVGLGLGSESLSPGQSLA